MSATSPARRSVTAGGLPLYGMWTRLTPAIALNSSPDKCGAVPVPAEAKFNWPGRLFARAMSSFTDLAGTDGCTTSTLGAAVVSAIGAKSRTKSNGSFG